MTIQTKVRDLISEVESRADTNGKVILVNAVGRDTTPYDFTAENNGGTSEDRMLVITTQDLKDCEDFENESQAWEIVEDIVEEQN